MRFPYCSHANALPFKVTGSESRLFLFTAAGERTFQKICSRIVYAYAAGSSRTAGRDEISSVLLQRTSLHRRRADAVTGAHKIKSLRSKTKSEKAGDVVKRAPCEPGQAHRRAYRRQRQMASGAFAPILRFVVCFGWRADVTAGTAT
uniref:Uncharacterized protein n=1 Tax=Rhipicephalus zambeziensis TaxID=60191 RepID=A0A224Y6C4_9ACAR